MSLSEIVGASGLAFYAEAALLLFFCVFVAVAFHVSRRQLAESFRVQSNLPFEDGEAHGDRRTSNDVPGDHS